jgi:hypothetical protein
MSSIDRTSSSERGKDAAHHSGTIIDIASSSQPGMPGRDAESDSADAPVEGSEQSRGRTMMRMPRSFDNAKASRKIVLHLTSDSEPGNNVASTSKPTEQPTEATTTKLDSQCIAEASATSISVVKTPSTAATPTFEETEPTFHLDIRHEPENPNSDPAPQELVPDCLILDKPMARNLIGKGAYGWVHSVKVIRYGERVKQRLMELAKASEVPKDYRVALKTVTWKEAKCECDRCNTRNKLRRRRGLASCRSFLPHHLLQCGTTRTFSNEIGALKCLIGIAGIQQIIGYEVHESDMSGRLISEYPLLWCDGAPSRIL